MSNLLRCRLQPVKLNEKWVRSRNKFLRIIRIKIILQITLFY
jgi:hypothetical protein